MEISNSITPIFLLAETVTTAKTSNVAILPMIFNVIGGLAIFLLGMKNMSEGLQAVAGQGLRRMISAVTDNRFMAVGVGTGITCLIQSSSITTVMAVGFVNSGFMTLAQAIPVVIGANIGTTITGWILVLQIGKWGLPILGLAAFFHLFARREKWRYTAMAIMGIGMIFFGLELMKNGFKPIRGMPEFMEWFQSFTADTYFGVLKCALVGCLLTMVVQSSSATLGITIGLASTGIISFPAAAALVLGENIGTTITAFLASLGTTTNAKRSAYFHIIFNLTGVAWITAIFGFYIHLIDNFVGWSKGYYPISIQLADDPTKYAMIVTFGIASVHTIFNITNTLLFMPFTKMFANLLTHLVPDKPHKEHPHLAHLDISSIESPVMGIEQSRDEILKMADDASKMMDWTKRIMQQDKPDDKLVQKVFHREEIFDITEREMVRFMTDLLSGSIPHSIAVEGRIQLRLADEYESMSDAIVSILKAHLALKRDNLKLCDDQSQNLLDLHDKVAEYLDLVNTGIQQRHPEIISKAHAQSTGLTHRIKELRSQHLAKLSEQKLLPSVSLTYTTMLANYRRIKEHALNIAEALADEK